MFNSYIEQKKQEVVESHNCPHPKETQKPKNKAAIFNPKRKRNKSIEKNNILISSCDLNANLLKGLKQDNE